jgi:hypothetical protein
MDRKVVAWASGDLKKVNLDPKRAAHYSSVSGPMG